jgi:hypothetical protein
MHGAELTPDEANSHWPMHLFLQLSFPNQGKAKEMHQPALRAGRKDLETVCWHVRVSITQNGEQVGPGPLAPLG